MKREKLYTIHEDSSKKGGITIIPSEYIRNLHPNAAINELEAHRDILINVFKRNKSDSDESTENIESMRKIELDIRIVESFLNDLKQGFTPKLLKYLDFEKDDIDWLDLLPEIIGEKKLDEITRQASREIREKSALGNTEEFEACLESVRINPNEAKTHYNLGLAYAKHGKYLEAINEFKQAVKIEPNHTDAHYSLGLTYGNLERIEEEIEAYNRTISIDPNYALAHYNLGVVYIELSRFQKAIEAFIQTICIEPNNAIAYDNLGSCYLELDHHQDAIEAFKNAIHIEPDLALAHFNLGRTYNMLDQYEKAIGEYKKTTLIEPNFPEAHALLGVNYLLIGDRDSALKEYEVLKNLDEGLANHLFEEIKMSK